MNLMNAVGKISDEHIAEFAYVAPKKFYVAPWMKIAAAAACLAAVVMVIKTVSSIKDSTVPPVTDSTVSQVTDSMPSSNVTDGLLPHVYFNDRAYVIYGRSDSAYILDELPDGYVEVGEIKAVGRDVNGYGEGPKIGEKIYQNADFSEDLYVYTSLFAGGKRYWYMLFTDRTFERVRIGGKTYVWDFDHKNRYLVDLPGGYELIGEVTTNDRSHRYTDGFGQGLNIGDTIYQAPGDPDTVYVKTRNFVDNYVRFKVYDTLSDDNTSSVDETSFGDLPPMNMPVPHVVINGAAYILNGHSSIDETFIDSLPEGYEPIGEVTCSDRENNGKEGFGAGFAVGNKIYQHPDKPEEVFVYTTLMTGGERYWYVNCVKSKLPLMNSLDN